MIRIACLLRRGRRRDWVARLCTLLAVVFLLFVVAHTLHDAIHDDAGALVCIALVVGVVKRLFRTASELFGDVWAPEAPTPFTPSVRPLVRDLLVRGPPPTLLVPLRR